MSLRRASLLLIAISALFLSASTFFQSPEEKEAPDIAKIRDEWFYAPRRDPQGHARGDLRLKALQQKQQMRRNVQPGGTNTQTPALSPSTVAAASTTSPDTSSGSATISASAAPVATAASVSGAIDLTSTPWQPIGPQPMNNVGL